MQVEGIRDGKETMYRTRLYHYFLLLILSMVHVSYHLGNFITPQTPIF